MLSRVVDLMNQGDDAGAYRVLKSIPIPKSTDDVKSYSCLMFSVLSGLNKIQEAIEYAKSPAGRDWIFTEPCDKATCQGCPAVGRFLIGFISTLYAAGEYDLALQICLFMSKSVYWRIGTPESRLLLEIHHADLILKTRGSIAEYTRLRRGTRNMIGSKRDFKTAEEFQVYLIDLLIDEKLDKFARICHRMKNHALAHRMDPRAEFVKWNLAYRVCSHCFRVEKKMRKCSHCKNFYYCSDECNTADWKINHKIKCKRGRLP